MRVSLRADCFIFAVCKFRDMTKIGLFACVLMADLWSVGACASELDRSDRYGLGTPASAEDIRRLDIDVMPNGWGLPPGQGSVTEGRKLYAEQCGVCHGDQGQGGSAAALTSSAPVDAASMADDPSVTRTIGNYWPYATTIFDYVRRAMPFDRPGSLTDEQVYALTAYLLYMNGLIDEGQPINARTLPTVDMPARRLYRSDNRGVHNDSDKG